MTDPHGIIKLFTDEEKKALKELCEAIVDDINGRVEMITRRKRVAPILKYYEISVNGISFSIEVSDDDLDFLMTRCKELGLDEKENETELTYIG